MTHGLPDGPLPRRNRVRLARGSRVQRPSKGPISMSNHAQNLKSAGHRLAGLLALAGAVAVPAISQAQVVAGDTAVSQVLLADADGVINPTTVAVRDGVAFVAEGQLNRVG